MDTSGFYPQLSDDDPLYEVADYTQLMKTKLGKMGVASFTSSGTINNAAVTPTQNIVAVAAETSNAPYMTFNSTDLTIYEAGIYGFSLVYSIGNGGTSGRTFVEIAPQWTVNNSAYRTGMAATEDTAAISIAGIWVPAGAKVKFNGYQSTGGSKPYTAAIQIMRFQ